MKNTNRLPRFFNRLFAFLELLLGGVAVTLSALFLLFPHLLQNAEVSWGEVGLSPEQGALTVQLDDANATAVSLTDLQGTVSIKAASNSNDLVTLTRWYAFPIAAAYAGFAILLFDLLRRLFRNVERGESFTEQNVHLVHKIGIAIIVFTLVSSAATSWQNYAVSEYLQHHATVHGIKMAFVGKGTFTLALGSSHYAFNINLGGFLTGLLILALGEVFRQGLSLKKEADLTI